MTRTRIVLTLVLVATVATLVGLASTVVMGALTPDRPASRPEATEPHRPAGMIVNV